MSSAFADVRYALDERHCALVSQVVLPHNLAASLGERTHMSDPLRTDALTHHHTPSPDGDAERDAKIESLLLSGLDHYFASDYAQAIDIWTRALFLDRQHARARAYIERARSALAEEQRQSEELLHNGIAAFERGEIEAARQLLNAAVQRGGAHEVALAFLTRIDRISAASQSATGDAVPTVPLHLLPAAIERRGSRWVTALIAAVILAAAGLAIAYSSRVRALLPLGDAAAEVESAPVPTIQDPLIVPRAAETALSRAQALFESGRLYDALRTVDLVRSTDPLRPEAEKLKGTIQRQLLELQSEADADAASMASDAARSGAGAPRPSTSSGRPEPVEGRD